MMSLGRTLQLCPQLARLVQVQTMSCWLHVHGRWPLVSSLVAMAPRPSSVSWLQTRSYAKKGKDKGHQGLKVVLTSEQLEGVADMEAIDEEMRRVLEDLKQHYLHQLSLRTTAGAFHQVMVSTDDGRFPLIQLGQIVQKTPQLVLINMAAAPQYVKAVKTAITQSGLNVNPQQDGTTIFLPLPVVTREHRENMAKSAKQICDKAKVKLRDINSKHVKKVRNKTSGPSIDTIKVAEQMILQKMHQHSSQAEAIMKAKQNDLLGNK